MEGGCSLCGQSAVGAFSCPLSASRLLIPSLPHEALNRTHWRRGSVPDTVHTSLVVQAMVPKVINQHQQQFVERGIGYDVLSNDNGFLPYADNANSTFHQRTLVARWALNATDVPGATRASYELVRKPVLNVMALLARLGDRLYDASSGALPAAGATLGILGTSRGFDPAAAAPTDAGAPPQAPELAALVYNSADDALPSAGDGSTAEVTLRFRLSAAAQARLRSGARVAMFRLDQAHGNAFAEWESQGFPRLPSLEQFERLRDAAEVTMEPGFPRDLDPAAPLLRFQVPRPGIVLVHGCGKSEAAPPPVVNVRLHAPARASDVSPTQKLLVLWDVSPRHRCLSSFEVRCGATRVNRKDTIFTSFAHVQNYTRGSLAPCCYSVVAVDYWGRRSAPTAPVCPPRS